MATVIDLSTRMVVGWSMANHMRASLVIDALSMARDHGHLAKGAIFHSDRGSQYTSAAFQKWCGDSSVTQSMGAVGVCWDAMAESFFATLKTEFLYRRVWPTRKRAKTQVGAWIEGRYNRRRRHASIGQITPVTFELQYSNQTADLQQAA